MSALVQPCLQPRSQPWSLAGVLVLAQQSTSAAGACPATSLSRTGAQSTGINQSGTDGAWNLREAVWNRTGITYPIRSDSWTRGCIVGGTVNGDIPRCRHP